MFSWGAKKREPGREATGLSERLNELETRLERLELDNAERQVAVLNALEKVMTQFKAREAKRARDAEVQGTRDADPEATRMAGVAPSADTVRRGPSSSAHLARRFRQGL